MYRGGPIASVSGVASVSNGGTLDLNQSSLPSIPVTLPSNVKLGRDIADVATILTPEVNGVIFPNFEGRELSEPMITKLFRLVRSAPTGAKNWGRTEFNDMQREYLKEGIMSALSASGINASRADLAYIMERVYLTYDLVSAVVPKGSIINGRLCLGAAGLGERYHDDANNIVATVALSGPGTRYVASRDTDSARGSNGSYQTIGARFTEDKAYKAETGEILLMRGSFWGSSKFKETPPFLPIPGLVHRKPDPIECHSRLCFVAYTKFSNQAWCKAKEQWDADSLSN